MRFSKIKTPILCFHTWRSGKSYKYIDAEDKIQMLCVVKMQNIMKKKFGNKKKT